MLLHAFCGSLHKYPIVPSTWTNNASLAHDWVIFLAFVHWFQASPDLHIFSNLNVSLIGNLSENGEKFGAFGHFSHSK